MDGPSGREPGRYQRTPAIPPPILRRGRHKRGAVILFFVEGRGRISDSTLPPFRPRVTDYGRLTGVRVKRGGFTPLARLFGERIGAIWVFSPPQRPTGIDSIPRSIH